MKREYIHPEIVIIESILEHVINAGSDKEPEESWDPEAKQGTFFFFENEEEVMAKNQSVLWDDDNEEEEEW